MGQVLKLAGSKQIAPKRRSISFAKSLRRQSAAAVGIGFVAATLVALSLTHLAHGIEIVTNCPTWEGWAMGIVVDCGFIGLEMAQVMAATEKVRTQIKRWAPKAVAGMLVGSACMNAFAFVSGAVGWMQIPAVIMGVAIPAFLYALTRVGAVMYIDCHSRA